jgi:WD40-like Beta Propeller Repeat
VTVRQFGTRDVVPGQPSAGGRFSIQLPPDAPIAALDAPAITISPDGKRIAFVAGSNSRPFVRELDQPEPRSVPGTDGASSPFFSPDSRFVAFFVTGGRINKVSVDGGDPVTVCLCGASNPRGGAWNRDGTIAFTPAPGSALFRVNAAGGTREPLTKLDVARGEAAHHWPEYIPDGSAILYTVGTGEMTSWDDREITVESLVTRESAMSWRMARLHGMWIPAT